MVIRPSSQATAGVKSKMLCLHLRILPAVVEAFDEREIGGISVSFAMSRRRRSQPGSSSYIPRDCSRMFWASIMVIDASVIDDR